jgi:hypothetical protein
MMDEVQNPSNPEHYIPSSESFRIYFLKLPFADAPTSTVLHTAHMLHYHNFTAYIVSEK